MENHIEKSSQKNLDKKLNPLLFPNKFRKVVIIDIFILDLDVPRVIASNQDIVLS